MKIVTNIDLENELYKIKITEIELYDSRIYINGKAIDKSDEKKKEHGFEDYTDLSGFTWPEEEDKS